MDYLKSSTITIIKPVTIGIIATIIYRMKLIPVKISFKRNALTDFIIRLIKNGCVNYSIKGKYL